GRQSGWTANHPRSTRRHLGQLASVLVFRGCARAVESILAKSGRIRFTITCEDSQILVSCAYRERMGTMAIISRSVWTVSRETTVREAVEHMASAKVGSVVVVNEDRVIGIFSERDVMLRVVLEGRDPRQTKVEEVMTSRVHSISSHTTG